MVSRSLGAVAMIPRAMIEPPSFRQYEPGDFQAFRLLNWNEIINKDDEDENWGDPGVLSSGRSSPGVGNDNDNGQGEEEMQGSEKEIRKGKGTQDWKGKGKGTGTGKGKAMEEGNWKGNGNGRGKGIVELIPGRGDISPAVALQLQKER